MPAPMALPPPATISNALSSLSRALNDNTTPTSSPPAVTQTPTPFPTPTRSPHSSTNSPSINQSHNQQPVIFRLTLTNIKPPPTSSPDRTHPPPSFTTITHDLHEGTVIRLGRLNRDKEGNVFDGQSHTATPSPATESNMPHKVPMKKTVKTAAGVHKDFGMGGGEGVVYEWFVSKVVSRVHAEVFVRGGSVYVRDSASSSGTFLNGMRLSPSVVDDVGGTGKESRPHSLKSGDRLQLGVDYQGKEEGWSLTDLLL
ncbi:hypothetical protein HDV00_004045 [Rhizophlyctis rosea]|nr:hypothetical protein HDV00_004045 [Rhizophlyctis rosea]